MPDMDKTQKRLVKIYAFADAANTFTNRCMTCAAAQLIVRRLVTEQAGPLYLESWTVLTVRERT
jgi:hypothetical protein